jgi:GNAT superfamily N-acetyltransferase
MDYSIIRIPNEDLDTAVLLIRESFSTVAKQFGLTIENCPTNGAFMQNARLESDWRRGDFMFGLYHEATLAGFMQLEVKSPELIILQKLAVHPDYRRLGFGSALLDFAEMTAGDLKAKKIAIAIIEENTVLKKWYLYHGFTHTGTKIFEHLPFTVGFMEKEVGSWE